MTNKPTTSTNRIYQFGLLNHIKNVIGDSKLSDNINTYFTQHGIKDFDDKSRERFIQKMILKYGLSITIHGAADVAKEV